MFGVFFLNQHNLTRLLTDYGFQGYGRSAGVVASFFFIYLANNVIRATIMIAMFSNLNHSSEKHLEKRLSRRTKSVEVLKTPRQVSCLIQNSCDIQ